jgi:hypothetical protein
MIFTIITIITIIMIIMIFMVMHCIHGCSVRFEVVRECEARGKQEVFGTDERLQVGVDCARI